MKKICLIAGYCLLMGCFSLAQDVAFSFENAQNTNTGGTDYYEVDVMIASTATFKLGSGQLYFNYNTAAFGENIFANNKVEVSYPNTDYVLGQKDNLVDIAPIYGFIVENDNLPFTYSFSWQQDKEGDCINTNVTGVPTKLLHLKIEYADVNQPPGVCFESSPLFTDQTFTHCGNNNGTCMLAGADCINEPGSQIINDSYDCTGAALLPLDLLLFYAAASGESDVLLNWETANEMNTSHFEIERSTDGKNWQVAGAVGAAGHSSALLNYAFLDRGVAENDGLNHRFYYRLRMVDLDGSFEYSVVRMVSFDGQSTIRIYPNPTSWGVQVDMQKLDADTEEVQVSLYSQEGKLVFTKTLDAVGGRFIFPDYLPEGVYQIVIKGISIWEDFYERVVLMK